MTHKQALTVTSVIRVVCALLIIVESSFAALLVHAKESDKSTSNRRESYVVQEDVVIKTHQETSDDQDAVKLGRAADKLTAMLSAASTIQDTLELAFQRQAQLLKDLTALQNDLNLISQGHEGTLTDDSNMSQFGGGPSIPGKNCPTCWFIWPVCQVQSWFLSWCTTNSSNACNGLHKDVPLIVRQ